MPLLRKKTEAMTVFFMNLLAVCAYLCMMCLLMHRSVCAKCCASQVKNRFLTVRCGWGGNYMAQARVSVLVSGLSLFIQCVCVCVCLTS